MTFYDELDDVDEEEPTPVPRVVEREWDDLAWQDRAACSDAETDLFFAPFMEHEDDREAREAYVLDALCAGCPVRRDCRDFGRRHREFGIWGETEHDRARAGFGPPHATGREMQRLNHLSRLERDGMIAR